MKLNILLLCDKPQATENANTILDHIGAFENHSCHRVWACSFRGEIPSKLDLNKFDVIIIHYTLSLIYDHYLSPISKYRLREFSGLKIVFAQDEYRAIDQMISQINFIKGDVLFTCFPDSEIENIYPDSRLPNLSKYNQLTGYIPEHLLNLVDSKKIAERPIDVGYRGRKIPFWLGELAYEKFDIADRWQQFTRHSNLAVDISCLEEDRLYGKLWVDFLTSCKTVLGVESGASVMDFSGNLEKVVKAHLVAYPNDTFEEVQKKYFLDLERKHALNQISPRCFESIAVKTGLILYEGSYSGILLPDRHYIMLKKDFSNIDDVLTRLNDDHYLQTMTDVAYEEIALNPEFSYQAFIHNVDHILSFEFKERGKIQLQPGDLYTGYEFSEAIFIPCDNKINGLPSPFINYLLNKATTQSTFKRIKWVMTHKIKIFNPVLRRIKQKFMLRFMKSLK